MDNGQWQFIHERIKSSGFDTKALMIHEWVMGNGNSRMNQSKVFEFYTNVPMNNNLIMGNGNSYSKESKVLGFHTKLL